MPNRNNKGAILFIVIGIILVVGALSTVILGIVSNHSRLIHHQVSRIQALYAAKAGMVWALEMLRTGVKSYPGDCTVDAVNPCILTETGFPPSIKSVRVIFCPGGVQKDTDSTWCIPPPGIDFCIYSTANFTYSS